jgi:hypothetical protein
VVRHVPERLKRRRATVELVVVREDSFTDAAPAASRPLRDQRVGELVEPPPVGRAEIIALKLTPDPAADMPPLAHCEARAERALGFGGLDAAGFTC